MLVPKKKSLLSRSAPVLLVIYCLTVVGFIVAELNIFGVGDSLRATNQVLILFALLILPFVVMNMPTLVQSLTFKVSDKEIKVQLHEMEQTITGNIGKVERQVSTAEQALWPILAGVDVKSDERLSAPTRRLIIGSKLDISQDFFTQLLAQTIEKCVPDVECEIRYPNGGSLRNFAEVKNRWVDLYIDYTGTCCQYFNIQHKNGSGQALSDEQIIAELNRYGQEINMEWLAPLGASEDYCLVMEHEVAKEEGVSSLADLKRVADKLVFTADPEFINRKDCYLGLKKYGIRFKEVIPCHVTERYALLGTGKASVFVGYESDPPVINKKVLKLADPDQFFPRYMALPLVNRLTLEKVPGLREALHKLAGKISTDDLNQAVMLLGKAHDIDGLSRSLAKNVVDTL